MRPKPPFFLALLFLNSLPSMAEAATAAPGLQPGDRVLVTGMLHRKCSARIRSIADAGAKLEFDRAGCGDAERSYGLAHLQRITFLDRGYDFIAGDAVVVKGHFGFDCAARVREISRTGYVAVDLEAPLCADAAALHRAADIRKISFVDATGDGEQRFAVGQRVSAAGIHEGDTCRGEIRKLTDGGLAQIQFDELTCAYGGKLFPVAGLKALRDPGARRHAAGEQIFQRVMREIASQKKAKKKLARSGR